jgi:hypothetical protein
MLMAEPGGALVRRADDQVAAAWHAPFGGSTQAVDPSLDRHLNQDPRPFVWAKAADQILDAIATYCQRINDSGH